MLTAGECFNDRKAFLWSFIHVSQELIAVLQKMPGENRILARELIAQEREIIKKTYMDLKELQRWYKTTTLAPDEPFYYKKEVKNEGN